MADKESGKAGTGQTDRPAAAGQPLVRTEAGKVQVEFRIEDLIDRLLPSKGGRVAHCGGCDGCNGCNH